ETRAFAAFPVGRCEGSSASRSVSKRLVFVLVHGVPTRSDPSRPPPPGCHLGPLAMRPVRPHCLDLALLVVAGNEAPELEGCEEHDRDQQRRHEQEPSTYLQCASHRSSL